MIRRHKSVRYKSINIHRVKDLNKLSRLTGCQVPIFHFVIYEAKCLRVAIFLSLVIGTFNVELRPFD